MIEILKKVSAKYILMLSLILLALILSIYGIRRGIDEPNPPSYTSQPKGSGDKNISVWAAYWNGEDALEELSFVIDKVDSVQAFAAIFDERDKIIFPSKYLDTLLKVKAICNENNKKLYLTIVNDRVNSDKSIAQKDSDMLRRILSSEESYKVHIEEILAYAKEGGYDGVEIDYEKIPKDIWKEFGEFITKLYEQLQEEGINLRIILEPNVETDKIKFPNGPEYLMMAYNLYGSHSGPGPKADVQFIKKVASNMDNLSGKKWMAFSTGGFRWVDGKVIAQVTEKEAAMLAKEKGVKINRDNDSGAVNFQYMDKRGKENFVWYADEKTLDKWITISKDCGYDNIALWKLGGNGEDTLKYIKGLR